MPAKLHFRQIQYIDDFIKDERRNVGVIAYGDEGIFLRFLGQQLDDSIDLSSFSKISKLTKNNAWVFSEWVYWFRCLAEEYKDNQQELRPVLDKLLDDGSPFVAGNESVIDIPEHETALNAVNWLSDYLLPKALNKQEDFDFEEALNKFLQRNELIPQRRGFEKKLEIEFTPQGSSPIKIAVDYAVIDEPNSIFKVLEIKGSEKQMLKKVNDIVSTFERAVEHGFVTRDNCFLLTNKLPKPELMETVTTPLKRIYKVIDISGDSTTSAIY